MNSRNFPTFYEFLQQLSQIKYDYRTQLIPAISFPLIQFQNWEVKNLDLKYFRRHFKQHNKQILYQKT